jgi:hypothetical protein
MLERCAENLTTTLIDLPESGMGYQLVNFNGSAEPTHIVLNGILIAYLSDRSIYDALFLNGIPRDLEIASNELNATIRQFNEFPTQSKITLFIRSAPPILGLIATPPVGPIPFTAAPVPVPALHLFFSGTTEPLDRYTRFSPVPIDPRIFAIKGGIALKPGTYATTNHDADCANNGAAAVGRYALPNLAPAIFRTDFAVAATTSIRYGTSLPAFLQAGGGSEVHFANQTTIPRKASRLLPVV